MSGYGFKRGEGRTLPIVVTKDNAISRGRFINKIEYRKTDKAEFLTIEVIDKAGFTARKAYFPPNKVGSLYVPDQTTFDKELQKFNRVMKNLTNVLLTKDYETGDVATFEQFCNRVILDIGKAYYNKELRIKLVYDKKNQPTLPNYPTMFEDPSLVSDENTKMTITQWDKVEPTEVEMDKDVKVENIELKGATEPKKDDGLSDLPF
jgi:hypothetical protein